MAWYEWIISLVLFIVSLGALICIHEAGHLSMAKLFNVYCKEYSIGFGPALLHKRKEGKETYFSIRAIPLGGYVSMYGEEAAELDEGLNIPKERSLEGIKKWKKAIIVSAGVILNAILALVLIGISDIAFPQIQFSRVCTVAENSLVANAGVKTGDSLQYIYPDSQAVDGGIRPFTYEYQDEENLIHAGSFFIVDTNVVLPNGKNYVLAYMFTGDKKEPNFCDGLKLYQAISKNDLETNYQVNEMFKDWAKLEGSPEYYPVFTSDVYHIDEETKFTANLQLFSENIEDLHEISIEFSTELIGKNYQFKDIGLTFQTQKVYAPLKQRIKWTFQDYGNASVAVFKGIGTLFTTGIKNMSGIVGIFEASASLYTNYTFATYLYFWGLISVNLAIFNLLPFPGLDGWQLLVTIIEGITKKKLPEKFKSIMSFVGLIILFALMIAIVAIDIGRIVGV